MTPNERLLDACRDGRLDKVRKLLKRRKFFLFDLPPKANIHAVDEYGGTALHCASLNGHMEVVKFLIDMGANINGVPHKYVQPPLLGTLRNDHLKVAELLISKGANVDDTDNHGLTPWDWATELGYGEILEALQKAPIGKSPRIVKGPCRKHWNRRFFISGPNISG